MSQERAPILEILFDELDANTYHPASTIHDVPVSDKDENGIDIIKHITVLRKYLKLVVRNSGNYVAENCIAKCKVIIPAKDKDSDNFLRYPSTETKLLMWDPIDRQVSPITSINVNEEERLYVVVADSDYKGIPIVQAPSRAASLANQLAMVKLGREGLQVQDSFTPGDYEIQVSVTSKMVSTSASVIIHVDADPISTVITKVGPVGQVSLPFDARSRKRIRKKQ